MGEIRTETKSFMVNFICDKCKKGEMKYTGISQPTSPIQYVHECFNCKEKQTFTKCYSFIIHEKA